MFTLILTVWIIGGGASITTTQDSFPSLEKCQTAGSSWENSLKDSTKEAGLFAAPQSHWYCIKSYSS